MKKTFISILILFSFCTAAFSQATWTQKANFGGANRCDAFSFSIGTKGYLGTGRNSITAVEYVDFWEYDPATNSWSQKANFGGGARHSAVGFAINNKGYAGTGYNFPNATYYSDFWEYDPANNSWIQKSNFGGSVRYEAAAFAIGSKGYIGVGSNGTVSKKDFWEFDPAANSWVQKADFGGVERYEAAYFAIGSKGYVGVGENFGPLSDFWEFDPSANSWSQIASFGGAARWAVFSFSLGNNGYVGTGVQTGFSYNDVWAYNPGSNSWSYVNDFANSSPRWNATAFTIGNKAYAGMGTISSGETNDLWEFSYMTCPPVANYPFSGNALDFSGNVNNGTNNGASLVADRFGNPNSAYEFNGTSDYIANNAPMTGDVPFTIASWIKLDTYGDRPIYTFGYSANGLNQLTFGNLNGALTAQTPGANDVTSLTAVVPLSQWTHVAVVHTPGYNINSFKFYINGVEYAANHHLGTNVPFPTASNGAIGAGRSGSFFDGMIDDLKIYDCALSVIQIDSIYNAENYLQTASCDTLYYGTSNTNFFGQVVKSPDGNIVTVGTENHIYNWSNGDIVLNKYDIDFNLIWSRHFYVGGGMDVASGLLATSDGGYLIHAAFGNSNAAGSFSAGYIIKTDSAGIQEWVQTLTGQNSGDNYGSVAVENSLGEFICYGHVQHHAGCNSYATRITKISATGSIVWSNCMSLNPDLTGGITKLTASDFYVSVLNNPSGVMEMRKWDDNGNQTGLVNYQYDGQYVTSGGVQHSKTGGYYLTGRYTVAGNQNAFVAKFDDAMNLVWEASESIEVENQFSTMTEDAAGNVYCTGITNAVGQPWDLIMTKYNSNGAFQDHAIFGNGTDAEYPSGILVLANNDVICSGRAASQALLVKFCDAGTTGIVETEMEETSLSLYPNPASDILQLNFNLDEPSPVTISIYNISGQRIMEVLHNQLTSGRQEELIPVDDLVNGIYFVRVEGSSLFAPVKFVIAR